MAQKEEYPVSEDGSGKAGEPASVYHKPRIRFFSSPEEQRKEMYSYWASLSPVERMTNLLKLIIKAYDISEERLHNPQIPKNIRLIKRELPA